MKTLRRKKELPIFCNYNPGQRVVNKFTKLSKLDFCMECFTADFLRVFNKNVKIWPLGVRLGTRHQI